ncbi:MAG TPA: CopD family protein [Anaerolineae bacterium]|nr:CopD family protein [Anaerolineae bacterium]
MPKPVVFAVVVFLHDLFTSVWIGGLITLGVTVLPSARQVLGKGPQMKKLLSAIQKRLSVLVYASIVGLIVTGVLQANRNPAFEGLFRFGSAYSTTLSLKHIAVAVMIGITLLRSLVLSRRHEPLTPSQERLSMGLLLLNLALGIVVLLLTGLSVAFGAPQAA